MKIILRIWNTLTTTLVVLVVILAILLVGVRIIGLTPFAVLSGSMEPAFKTGSLIYVKNITPEDVKIGDPITFVLNQNLVVATHRVIEIDSENTRFYTKGDNNDVADAAPIHFNNLIGIPIFTIPYLGYASNFLSETKGIIVTACALLILVILVFIPDVIRGLDTKRKPHTKSERHSWVAKQ